MRAVDVSVIGTGAIDPRLEANRRSLLRRGHHTRKRISALSRRQLCLLLLDERDSLRSLLLLVVVVALLVIVTHLTAHSLQVLFFEARLTKILALSDVSQGGCLVTAHLVHYSVALAVMALNDLELALVQGDTFTGERKWIRSILHLSNLIRKEVAKIIRGQVLVLR